MMRSHFVLLALFAFFVSLVFSLLGKDTAEQQLRFGGMLFAGFLVAALVLGWLMYLFSV
jgi:prepilin signal peptidase PulO-like enzyme (type II secretory pathway)